MSAAGVTFDRWPPLPSDRASSARVIALFSLRFSQHAVLLSTYERLLSQPERLRAARFVHASDRAHFTIARGALRWLLGRRLGCDGAEVILGEGPHGKPALVSPPGPDLHFNLTHSGDFAIFAFGPSELGVDVERARPDLDVLEIAAHFFAEPERAAFAGTPEECRATFYRLWTRKEAYLKAIGSGLRVAPGSFVVTAAAQEARLVAHAADPLAPGRWSIRDLPAPEGYAAAICVDGGPAQYEGWMLGNTSILSSP